MMHHSMPMNATMAPSLGMDHGSMAHMGGMKMAFFFSKKTVILFEGWSVDTVGGMIGSCIAVFILAVLYEGLKVSREMLKRRYGYVMNVDMDTKVYGSNQNQTVTVTETRGHIPRSKICNLHHFIQSLLHIVQVTLSYFLMLIFMTYNGWLCIAVALGAGFGYFLFGWKLSKIVDINEHCH